jgi:hypothetical protein
MERTHGNRAVQRLLNQVSSSFQSDNLGGQIQRAARVWSSVGHHRREHSSPRLVGVDDYIQAGSYSDSSEFSLRSALLNHGNARCITANSLIISFEESHAFLENPKNRRDAKIARPCTLWGILSRMLAVLCTPCTPQRCLATGSYCSRSGLWSRRFGLCVQRSGRTSQLSRFQIRFLNSPDYSNFGPLFLQNLTHTTLSRARRRLKFKISHARASTFNEKSGDAFSGGHIWPYRG